VRVRVSYSTDVDDFYRRAINNHFGKPGLATRAEVQEWLRNHGSSSDDDIIYDLQQKEAREEQAVHDCIEDYGS
jgi:hypothetical protein